MNTDDLIQRLGAELTPVRPLAPPWKRAFVWLACGAAYIAVVVLSEWMRRGALGTSDNPVYLVQQAGLIATAIAAALAAFVSVIPGADRRLLAAPLVPGAVVAAALLWGCTEDVRNLGTLGIGRETDWPCVISITVGGAMLWGVAVAMLRRGAPLAPRVTSLLAGGGAVSLANIEACLSRPHAFSSTVVLWHGVTTALVLVMLVSLAREALPWRAANPSE
jgi:hypothetical protein